MKQMLAMPEQDSSQEGQERSTARNIENKPRRIKFEFRHVDNEDPEAVERIETVREKIKSDKGKRTGPRDFLLGKFDRESVANGRLQLKGAAKKSMEAGATTFRNQAQYMTNMMTGKRIATEYGSRTNNFSTQTQIQELPDGRKAFMVYNHAGSWLHRWLDTAMKRASGLRMRKATHDEWKTWFEEKSNIPVIENNDPNTVVMPFIPNVNALDAFVHDKEIKKFGECAWAEHLTPEDKLELAHRIMDEMRRLHGKGTVWGEAILPNIIFTKDRQPVICDPEVRFDEDMPLKEAMARDLKDICLSIGSALATAEGLDVETVVQGLLDRYGDREVVIELQNLAHQKSTLLQRLTKGYELVRSGAGTTQRYDTILGAIRDYDTDRLLKKRLRSSPPVASAVDEFRKAS